jgi:hypothetical protein
MDLSLATPELRPRCFEIQSLTSISMEVRDEGYSPSPSTRIDKDEGYSPSPDSVSILCDQNSLFIFPLFLEPESFHFSLWILRPQSPLPTPRLFSCLFQQDCVLIKSRVCGQVRNPYRWAVYPIPSLTLEEVFPPTSLTIIHFRLEGCSDLEQLKPA